VETTYWQLRGGALAEPGGNLGRENSIVQHVTQELSKEH